MVEMKTVIPKIDEQTGVAWLTFNRPEKKNAHEPPIDGRNDRGAERDSRQRKDQMCRHHRTG